MNRRQLLTCLATFAAGLFRPLYAQLPDAPELVSSPPRSVISADGTAISYAVAGNGPTIILLHGLAGNGEAWRDPGYVAALAGQYRLVLVDLRGHGRSGGPTDPDAYDYRELAADIAAVAKAESSSPVVLWGYSAGGGVAMATIAYYPQLFSKAIIGGSYRAAVGFPEGSTEGMLANARNYSRMASLPADEIPAGMRSQNIGALGAFLEKGSYFNPDIQAHLKDFTGPALMYLGAADAGGLHQQEAQAKVSVEDFFSDLTYLELPGNLSHGDAFARSDIVLPYVLDFLAR
jgi:pimeloyl-ACP methyl ester carboxylesterase